MQRLVILFVLIWDGFILTSGLCRNVTGHAYTSAFFGKGTGRVAMSRVDCNGSEVSLFSCPADMTGGVNCDHTRDAGVSCSGIPFITFVFVDYITSMVYLRHTKVFLEKIISCARYNTSCAWHIISCAWHNFYIIAKGVSYPCHYFNAYFLCNSYNNINLLCLYSNNVYLLAIKVIWPRIIWENDSDDFFLLDYTKKCACTFANFCFVFGLDKGLIVRSHLNKDL